MGTYITEDCFFTGKKVIRNTESDNKLFDGYYYIVEYNNVAREIRVSHYDNWNNDTWVKKNGAILFELIEKNEKWDVFKTGKTLDDLKELFWKLKTKQIA